MSDKSGAGASHDTCTTTPVGQDGAPENRTPNPEEPSAEPRNRPSQTARIIRQISNGSTLTTVLAIAASLVVGAIFIVLTNSQVQQSMGSLLTHPLTPMQEVGHAVADAYASLFRGGIYDYTQPSFVEAVKPLFTSLSFAAPLIAAGLGIGIGFRAGIFNIGGQGQILVGGALAGWIGYALPMPAGIHLLVAVVAGLIGGALFAGIAGLLKATTGAHEVIVTIMLNYIAFYLLSYLLTTVMKASHSDNPTSPPELPTAVFPSLLGSPFALNLGLIVVIALVILSWWLISRSSLGFQFRAVGENPEAARTAGINVKRVIILTMLVSGGLVGFAGVYQVLGQTTTGFTSAFDAGIGFNAITVALLGRNKPMGILWAGILFGVFQAGGYAMQADEGVDINIVDVLQSIIVLFIAAPPLVRTIFRLPAPDRRRRRSTKEATAR
ncbi:ABC transporter permease [Streptomyces acidicola]|uniref:ABC transporter permease n=1 Tax=Streptomyces acidicola TaxID=2596892 RepID=UPI0034473C77